MTDGGANEPWSVVVYSGPRPATNEWSFVSTYYDDGSRIDVDYDLDGEQWYASAINWFDARGNFYQQTGVADNGDTWLAGIENNEVQTWTVTDGGANDAWSTVVNKEYDAQRGEWRSLEIRYDDGTWSRSYLNDDGDHTELSVSSDNSVTVRNTNGVSVKFDGASLSHAVYRAGEDGPSADLNFVFYKDQRSDFAQEKSQQINPLKEFGQLGAAAFFAFGIWSLMQAGKIDQADSPGLPLPGGIPDGSQFIFSTEDGTHYYSAPNGQIWVHSPIDGIGQSIDLAPGQTLATDKDGFCTWVTVNRNGVSDQALEFQQRITGMPKGMECRVGGVDFDGFDYLKGVYLEAKGTGYNEHYHANGELKDLWFSGDTDWRVQMKRQVEAANGIVIEWHIAEDATNGFIKSVQTYIEKEELSGLVIVVQEKP